MDDSPGDRRGRRGLGDRCRLFGGDSFLGVSIGSRLALGGDMRRMGAYGALDPLAAAAPATR